MCISVLLSYILFLSQFQGLEGRENLARDLGIIEAEGTVGGPLLLEVIRRCQQKDKGLASGEVSTALSFAVCFRLPVTAHLGRPRGLVDTC